MSPIWVESFRHGQTRRSRNGRAPPVGARRSVACCAGDRGWQSQSVALVCASLRARSSAGEHCLHTAGVTGSIPVAPTIIEVNGPMVLRRPIFVVRPAWAHPCGWKSRHELVTASEVKRNCGRVTDRGEEAWSVNREPTNRNRIRGTAEQGERANNREALVIKARWCRSDGCAVKGCVPYLGRSRLVPERVTPEGGARSQPRP